MMKTVILVVLVLILAVLSGMFWNQLRERDDRLKREATIEQAHQQEVAREAAEKKALDERNRENVRRGAELDAEAEKKMKQQFGY